MEDVSWRTKGLFGELSALQCVVLVAFYLDIFLGSNITSTELGRMEARSVGKTFFNSKQKMLNSVTRTTFTGVLHIDYKSRLGFTNTEIILFMVWVRRPS